MKKENWKQIPGYENLYEVSDVGRVRKISLSPPEFLNTGNDQYPRVCLSKDNQTIVIRVHRLVLLAFSGPCPKGLECAHLNGNPHDNRLENLKWVTRKENHSHKWLHGTASCGEKGSNHKLKDSDIISIRKLRKEGRKLLSLAEQFGVSDRTICDVCLFKTWRHL